jgi:MFS family permease
MAARRLRLRPGQMISSLRTRNYRLFFFGQLVSVAGTWMQTVAQSFLVLGVTHSGTQLGLTTAARFLPMFVFGPIGGVFADRLDKRRVLYVTQTLAGLLAAAFAVLIATHSIRLWIIYLLALALGFVNVFDNPARQSFISEMVSAEDLPNAVTLNSVAMNMARVFGAAAGGVIAAAIGLAWCFGCNALSFAAVLISLAAMRRGELFPAARLARKKRQVRDGLRYVRSQPELLVPLLMIAVIGTLAWEFQVTLPLMASQAFGGGAATYGVMASVMGAGAVVGGLISAGRARPRARALCLAAIGWGIAILAAAAAPTLTLELVAMVFVGYGSITFNALAKTTLQLAAKPTMRGRVMALWALAWLGSTPIGGPIVGWAGQTFGARWSLVIGGLPTVICGIAALPALNRVDRRASRAAAPPPDEATTAEASTDGTAGEAPATRSRVVAAVSGPDSDGRVASLAGAGVLVQGLEGVGQGVRYRDAVVEAGQLEQAQDLGATADHVYSAAVRSGPLGRAAQGPQACGVDEADLAQVGYQGPTAVGQGRQLLLKLGHGGDVDLPGHGDQRVSRFALDPDGQRPTRVRSRPTAAAGN